MAKDRGSDTKKTKDGSSKRVEVVSAKIAAPKTKSDATKVKAKDAVVSKGKKEVTSNVEKPSKREGKAKAKDVKVEKSSKEQPVKAKEVAAAPKGKKVVKENPLKGKFDAALSAVKITAEKIKFGETDITVLTQDRLSAKQFGKLKSIAGKKLNLSARGDSWVMTYS